MDHGREPGRRPRLMLPMLAVLSFAAMGVVSYVLLACGDFEDACAQQEQRARIATVTRVRLSRSARGICAPRGALIAVPRDQHEVRTMVDFCDTATAADVPALRDVSLSAESSLAAGNAVRALGRLHAVAKDPELLKLLNDPRQRVRDETILALGESRDVSALVLLDPLVRTGDAHVRVLAVRAVGRIGGETARRMLEQVAADAAVTSETAAFASAGLAASGR